VRLFRIAIPASQIERSRAFYEQILAVAADDTVPSRLYFHCGGVIVALIDRSGQAGFRPNPDNIYFATADVEAAYDRALAAGASQLSAIERQLWGERSFYCLDPDGNPLCFVDQTTLFLGRGAA
jgi:predicted enzyme related to lactoylglutathione lyase